MQNFDYRNTYIIDFQYVIMSMISNYPIIYIPESLRKSNDQYSPEDELTSRLEAIEGYESLIRHKYQLVIALIDNPDFLFLF